MKASQTATERPASTLAMAPIDPRGHQKTERGPLVLGRYRLHRRLGAGGFGTVWMARDERLERDVAVKVLPRERISGGRFEREARAAARLAHPGIVTLYEAAVDDDGAYLVSELVEGSTLDSLLAAGRLSDRDIAAIGMALCDALAHAHAQAVVHRDVKPSNVLVPDHPATPSGVAKLTDFGVARVLGGDTLTRTGDVLGTAAYMAPEQAEGREAGGAADLYGLAVVLYEAFTGVNPLRTISSPQRTRRLAAHLPPLRRFRRDLPRELGAGIDLALRPRPRERGSIQELREALRSSLDQVGEGAGVVDPPWRPRRETQLDRLPDDAGPGRRSELASEPPLQDVERAPPPGSWPQRALAGLASAGLTVWLVGKLGGHPALAPEAAGAVALLLVVGLPRLGWIVLVAAGALALALSSSPGAALVVALCALFPIVLLIRRPAGWPLAAGAPALGAIGLAGAWPALAARARGGWQRFALGAIGWLWLLFAGALAGHGLYTRLPAAVPAPTLWTASFHETASHVLVPLLSGRMLAPALVWGVAASLLPRLTRRARGPRARIAMAAGWSLGLTLATVAILSLARAPVGIGLAAGILSAAGAAGVALVPQGEWTAACSRSVDSDSRSMRMR